MKHLYRSIAFLGESTAAPTIPVQTLESECIERLVCRLYGIRWVGGLQEGSEIPLGRSSRIFLASADEDRDASVGVFRCMLLARSDGEGSFRIGVMRPFLTVDEDVQCIGRLKAVEVLSSGRNVVRTRSDGDFLSVVRSVCSMYGLDFKDGRCIRYLKMKPKTTFFATLPTDEGVLVCDVSLGRRISGLSVETCGAVLFPTAQPKVS